MNTSEAKHLVAYLAWAQGDPLCPACGGVGEVETVDDGEVVQLAACLDCHGTGRDSQGAMPMGPA